MNRVKFRLVLSSAALIVVAAIGVVGFMLIEGLSFSEAFYLIVISLSTVGYGDVHPDTSGGRALAMAVIIVGVGLFMGVAANAVEWIWSRHEQRIRNQKLNMVVGVFFTEVGAEILGLIAKSDVNFEETKKKLAVDHNWTLRDYSEKKKWLELHTFKIEPKLDEIGAANKIIDDKHDIIVRLMENPGLLESESFTDLLWAVLHLHEECKWRLNLEDLSRDDVSHLVVDTNRVYVLLIGKWLDYMRHLQEKYPHLFKLAVYRNPFADRHQNKKK